MVKFLNVSSIIIFIFAFLIPIGYRINLYFIETSQVTDKFEKRYRDIKTEYETTKDETNSLLKKWGIDRNNIVFWEEEKSKNSKYYRENKDKYLETKKSFSDVSSRLVEIYPKLSGLMTKINMTQLEGDSADKIINEHLNDLRSSSEILGLKTAKAYLIETERLNWLTEKGEAISGKLWKTIIPIGVFLSMFLFVAGLILERRR